LNSASFCGKDTSLNINFNNNRSIKGEDFF